jgi:uncharacterized protein YodC (DUF2158 family)
MNEFKEGDSVWIKNQKYSPKLTIESINASKSATCIWFDLDNNLEKDTFNLSALTKEAPDNK